MANKPVIGKRERKFVYAFAIFTDTVQVIIDATIVAEPLNHIIDIVFGMFLVGYGLKRGILDWNKAMVLLATFFGEQIPYVNALPFWTYDIHNLYKGVPSTKEEQGDDSIPGVRPPRIKPAPLNSTPGRRPPRLPR